MALCVSFMVIIALLMSCHYLAYTFFRQNIRAEIIKSNSLNLNTTVTNYEKHLTQLKSYMMSYLFRTDTQTVSDTRNRPADYEMYRRVQLDLQNTLNNSILYIENIIYYFKDKQLLIDRNGTRDSETMFSKLYVSPTYSASFWNQEIAKPQSFRIFPGEPFSEKTSFSQASFGILMPVLAKKENDDQFGLIALLDGTQMFGSFHQPIEGASFYIFDPSGKPVFASVDRQTSGDPAFGGLQGTGHIERGDTLYLYQRAADSGYLYVDIIPMLNITNQIKRLNLIFVVILLASLLLSLLLAFLIARRFQNPLQGIMRTIDQMGQSLQSSLSPKQSRIKEFNLISDKIHQMFQTHHDINRDLDSKNSLLQHYAYISKLKMISTTMTDLQTAIDTDRPYRLILFHLELKELALSEMRVEPPRAYALMKEWIQQHFASRSPDSVTLQIEQDQILTILFEPSDPEEENLEPLLELLRPETSYFNFTIGLSPFRQHAQSFAETYDWVLQLIKQRTLGEHIQVFTRLEAQPLPLVPTLAQEQELATSLNAGNEAVFLPLVNKLIVQLHEAHAPAFHIRSFCQQMVEKTLKVSYAQNLIVPGYEEARKPLEQLKLCHTVEQYEVFFQRYLSAFAQAVRDKKASAEFDYMIKFVRDYVEVNYSQDISLDHLAAKLNITSSYLSAYFKEKTGTNLSEYTHSLRMGKAVEMLQNTNLKIQDIAAMIGYFTVAPFNRAFKRHTGATPTEYRRLNSNQ